jgi:hypothetical protein
MSPRYSTEGARKFADPRTIKGAWSAAACEFGAFLKVLGFPVAAARLKHSYCNPFDSITRKALIAYDGLNDSPDTIVHIPGVDAAGNETFTTTTVGQLGRVDTSGMESSRLTINGIIDDLVRDGVLSRSPLAGADVTRAMRPGAMSSARLAITALDSRLINPATMLDFPSLGTSHYWRGDAYTGSFQPRIASPASFPTLQRWSPLYFTPRFFDRNRFSDDAMVHTFAAVLGAIDAYLKAANCNPRFHPAMIAGRFPVPLPNAAEARFPRVRDTTSLDPRGTVGGLAAFREESGHGWEYAEASADLANAHIIITGPSYPTWRNSVTARCAVVNGENADFVGNSGLSNDATLETASLLNVAYAMIQGSDTSQFSQGVLVDMFATATAYGVCQEAAYNQIGQPYSTSVVRYRNAVEDEARARTLRKRTQAATLGGISGFTGYQSSGDGTEDIGAGLVASAALAVAAGLVVGQANAAAGVIVGACVFITGCAYLFTALSFVPEFTFDPTLQTVTLGDLRDRHDGVLVNGVTDYDAIRSPPVVRVHQ